MQRNIKIMASLLSVLILFMIMNNTTYVKASTKNSNHTPVITQGASKTFQMLEGEDPLTITLNAKDGDRDTSLRWGIYKKASNGTVKLGSKVNKTGTSQVKVTFTPKANYHGSDLFIVQVKDSKGAIDRIKIKITISPINDNSSDDTTTKTINYVALGDSIATGTIYPGAAITSYVTKIYECLKQQYPEHEITFTNLAANGARSNELYNKLGVLESSTIDTNMVDAIKAADIITISIGGNNLMQAAKDSTVIGGYNFNKIDKDVARQGVIDFNEQWVSVMKKIKELNSTAKIIVNTVFNPYNTSDPLHDTVDSYLFGTLDQEVNGINDVIKKNTELGYFVADVYTAYEPFNTNMGELTYLYPAATDTMGKLTRNPHPNEKGQNIITDLVKELLESK